MKNNRKGFILVACLQVLFLLGMVVFNASVFWSGGEVLLKTNPIDPPSLFSGQYARLNYEISAISLAGLGYSPVDSEVFPSGCKVFVRLQKKGNVWTPAEVSRKKSDSPGVSIRGKVVAFNEPRQTLFLVYGIERFYLSEGEALSWNKIEREQSLVRVQVDRWGRARVAAILLPEGE